MIDTTVVYKTEVSNVPEKITEIVEIIKTINNEQVAYVLTSSIRLAMKTIEQLGNIENKKQQNFDLSDQIDFVNDTLGFNLEDLVQHIVKNNFQEDGVVGGDKDVDPNTMEFITSDLDDYEKFVATAKAKESLDFLKQQL